MLNPCRFKVPRFLPDYFNKRFKNSIAAAALCFAGAFAPAGHAQVITPGDAVVTGFSGVKPSDAPVPPGSNPLDEFFIDVKGASAQILSLAAPGGPPSGQLIAAPPKLQIRAEQTGQVFAIGLDGGIGAKTPNLYLGATSAYGVHIVLPDADGDGAPERIKTGHPNAQFMPGQFGPGGGPGSIWRVDGASGAISLFATLPSNSGAGVGDVVFNKASAQFFASDLDNGLIYRLGQDGAVMDSFDHGVAGRPAKGLGALPDDGAVLDIKNAGFDSENPETWGYTPKDRMVWGMALSNARLYYAAAGQVWSVGVALDGSFAGDPRWEFDVNGLPGDGPVTDMLFDAQGRLTLAQRGAARGSYDYSQFAEPEKSAVVRYRRESPDNPATESRWEPEPDEYAIGMPPEHIRSEGGVALGYAHDETGAQRTGACNTMLWSTGHRLRPGASAEAAGGVLENDVHGLQGNDASLVRPQNAPPTQSYFADYDGFFGDAAKSGHMGDVEIWQPCEGVSTPNYGALPPGLLPPLLDPPGDYPPEFPGGDYETNLRLKKWADPKTCVSWGGGWLCRYRVRVTNTGPDTYLGPILVRDWLPATPAGAVMGFSAPWACWATPAPSTYRCWRPGVFLVPGASIELTAFAWVPKAYDKCHLTNGAAIEWAPPGSIWNSDPTDDIDFAAAIIPSKECKPESKKTDLKIYKEALLDCFEHGGGLRCGYKIRVENQGLGAYNGDIVVDDTIPAGTTAIFSGPGWDACPNAGNVYTCTYAGASLPNIGDAVSLIVRIDLSKDKAKELGCKVRNRAEIIKAPGGSDKNTDPANDKASALANVPAKFCGDDQPKKSNLKIEKKANPKLCEKQGGGWWCTYQIRVINTGPDVYHGAIEIEEALPAEPLDANWNAPWNCVGMGGGGGATCTHPDTNIAVNASKILTLKVKFANDVVKNKGCKLPNVAKIKKAPGGTDKNTDPGDDIAGDTGVVPEEFCKIEPTNLELQKYGAQPQCNIEDGKWRCPYSVIVKNMGPGDYNGEIVVKDWLPANAAGATMTVQAPWNCVGAAPSITCTHPNVNLPSSQQVLMQVMVMVQPSANAGCSLLNTARILQALGGSAQNTNAGDDEASATLEFPPLLAGGQAYCHTPVGAQPCPPGFKWDGERCERRRFCPQGTTGVWPDCRTPDRDCPRGWMDTPVNGKCCPPGNPWNAQTQECERDRTPPPPPQICPSGFRGEYPDCWKPGKPEQCQKTARCLDGRVWNREACACVCPPGKPWTGKKCGRDVMQPDPVCPKGFVGTPPNCRPLLRPCPQGYRGFIPNCRKIVVETPRCPRGFAGTPPNCRRLEPLRCPAGMIGKPPRCRFPGRPSSFDRPNVRPKPGRFDPRQFRPRRIEPQGQFKPGGFNPNQGGQPKPR